MAKRLCVRKSAASSEQVNKEQALTHDDVGGIQVSADFEEMFEVEIGKINHSKLINSLSFQGIFQFYTLKLLKMQARYLGRQWRRTNMEVISAIYMKIRHRLNDDWAFANETRCKSWDFQAEERQLKLAIEKFNFRRYGHIYPELAISVDVKGTCFLLINSIQFQRQSAESPVQISGK